MTAVVNMFRLLGSAVPKSQAFPMKGSDLKKKIRTVTVTTAGDYSSHSLWRGPPKGGRVCLIVSLLSGISGLSFDSPFLSPFVLFFCLVLLLFLSCHFSANVPFS